MLTDELIAQILAASRGLHASGSMSAPALLCLTRHLRGRAIDRSAETGTGATTLILSHISRRHEVFTVNIDESMSRVLESPLLNRSVLTFVEGPSQRTLIQHQFDSPLQAVIIDGPHAYPFPDLEYFCFYPHIETGGLLVVDDIHIPTVHSLFKFLRADDMFELVELCGTTAFFQRTTAPVFDPWGDGWWLQARNRRTLLRYSWPSMLKRAVPEKLRLLLRRRLDLMRMRRMQH
jgi:hypothetical protein